MGVLLSLLAAGLLAGQPAPRHHVLVISIDGMGTRFYVSPPPGIRIPNLLRLKRQGSYAEAVEGVYPSVTYPSHTTIVTGKLPAQHGIYTNLSSRVAGKNPNDWFWFSNSIRCATLWDEARRHGLSTATMGWPVTAGANVDWDVPEIWNPAKGMVPDPLYIAKFMNPQFALELLSALGPPSPNADNDALRTLATVYVLEKHKPDLTLVHLVDLDETEHHYGPESPEAAATLGRIDGDIGEILGAIREAGLVADTDVFIVSDHGFLPVERVISPNTLLVKAGLLTADARGSVTGGKIETVVNGGSFFIYWPKTENLRSAVNHALEPLLERNLVWAVLGPQALRDLGADPEAQLALDAPKGSMFGGSGRGPLVTTLPLAGTHGYLPFRAGLEASFIAFGPGIRPGVDLHRIRMTSVGPTILKAMGIADPAFGDAPPLDSLWK